MFPQTPFSELIDRAEPWLVTHGTGKLKPLDVGEYKKVEDFSLKTCKFPSISILNLDCWSKPSSI